MGMWIDKNHWSENFLTLARQYPKGMLKIKINIVRRVIFIILQK
jgi:hypothetical protein